MDPALRQVVLIFVEELREQLGRIGAALAAMERDAAAVPREIEELFRQAHSWKGSAASLGLDELAALAHDLESALTPVRRATAPLTPALLDAALVAVDAAGARIPGLVAESDEGLDEVAAATAQLRALTGDSAALPVPESEPVAREAERAVDPEAESVRVTVSRLTALERGLDDLRGLRSRLESQAEGAVTAIHAVDQLWRAARDGHRVAPNGLFALLSRLRGMRRALLDDAESLQSHVVDADETLRSMRMVPAGNLGEPLGRALRDACKRTGKEARLVIEGGDVQLDRHVLEELKGPLIHLVRNAIDHGVEAPEVREAIGKPARARVELVVRQELRTLDIEVSDDGRGIDVEAVREKARAAGLVGDDDAERLDDAQIIDLLFKSGFSTADTVTELSGRGVGLDVVRDAATRLQGMVTMTSTIGRGCSARLVVPLTIAAAEGIVVEERGRRFALPLAQVERVVRAAASELRDDGPRCVFDLDDEPLPIARLSSLLDTPPLGGKSAITILVARAGERRVGVVCERLIGQRELLLRPLPTELSAIEHISGVALLPSGDAVFVLSAAALARQAMRRRATATPATRRERSVLIADDSITIRSLLRHSLEAAGFRVRTATDGEEALQLTALESFDLVVADVRMPRVDGLVLTARLRASPRTARLPVVLFSSLASTQDREAGRAAGASAYLSKREFDRGELVDVIARLLEERGVIRVAVFVLFVLGSLPAWAAGGVVALTDGRVAQYREALEATRGLLPDAVVVDLAAGDPTPRLKELQPAVILAVGQRALQAARSAAPETPVVHCMVLGAAAAGTRAVTGVRLEVAPAELLAELKTVLPAARRIGVIYDPRALGWYHEEAEKAAHALGLSLVAKAVADARDVRGAADALAGQIDVLWLWPDPRLISSEMFSVLLLSTIDRHVALVGFLDSFTEKGALASVAPDYREAGRRAAKLVAELVARAPAARLPVPAPLLGPGALTINLKAAKQLGVEVPAAALARARQVYR